MKRARSSSRRLTKPFRRPALPGRSPRPAPARAAFFPGMASGASPEPSDRAVSRQKNVSGKTATQCEGRALETLPAEARSHQDPLFSAQGKHRHARGSPGTKTSSASPERLSRLSLARHVFPRNARPRAREMPAGVPVSRPCGALRFSRLSGIALFPSRLFSPASPFRFPTEPPSSEHLRLPGPPCNAPSPPPRIPRRMNIGTSTGRRQETQALPSVPPPLASRLIFSFLTSSAISVYVGT